VTALDSLGDLWQAGPSGVVLLFVVSILRGWLIPRRVHLDRVADLKATIEAQQETIAEQKLQIGILLGRAREPAA